MENIKNRQLLTLELKRLEVPLGDSRTGHSGSHGETSVQMAQALPGPFQINGRQTEPLHAIAKRTPQCKFLGPRAHGFVLLSLSHQVRGVRRNGQLHQNGYPVRTPRITGRFLRFAMVTFMPLFVEYVRHLSISGFTAIWKFSLQLCQMNHSFNKCSITTDAREGW